MDQVIIQKTKDFIQDLLINKLPKEFVFHDYQHTVNVTAFAQQLATQKSLSAKEIEMVTLAALLHDVGYTEIYVGHEAASRKIAAAFLQQHDYPPQQLEQVLQCIDATHPEVRPTNTLEEIIKDADLCNLGGTAFFELNAKLRQEWSVLLHRNYSDKEWLAANLDFLEKHKYHTPEAKKLLKPGKKKNRKQLKQLMKNNQKESSTQHTISGSKSAQMMFKTALRNHIDLTNIADNKANMMLSINALIITIAMPLLASNIQENRYLLLPSAILLFTCILSVIFATLATRPIKMMGNIPMENLNKGTTNVFFFGNFFKMSLPVYRVAVDKILASDTLLESTIINDLYFLGKALGEKYSKLRVCYAIFMIGMTLTVTAFAIMFFRSLS